MFATAMSDGVHLWDVETGDEAAHIHIPSNAPTFVGSDSLLTSINQGLIFWPGRRLNSLGGCA
jgi:hypothetical protein